MKNLPTVECSMLEVFEDTSLGNLNTIERDGTLYVPAIETAKILGYRNPRDTIRRHCVCDTITVDEWVITGKKTDGSDAMQCVHKKYIRESDFYRLIFHSRLPIAEEFTRWICEEVLPSSAAHPAVRMLSRKEISPECGGIYAGSGGCHCREDFIRRSLGN